MSILKFQSHLDKRGSCQNKIKGDFYVQENKLFTRGSTRSSTRVPFSILDFYISGNQGVQINLFLNKMTYIQDLNQNSIKTSLTQNIIPAYFISGKLGVNVR